MERLLNRNRIFVDRTKGIGVLTQGGGDQPVSCTGPIARASGVIRDLRKDEPYLAYPDFDFKVRLHDRGRLLRPLPGPHGGDASRACKIIEQAIENLPGGPVNVPIAEQVPAARQGDGLPQHRRD